MVVWLCYIVDYGIKFSKSGRQLTAELLYSSYSCCLIEHWSINLLSCLPSRFAFKCDSVVCHLVFEKGQQNADTNFFFP